MNDESNEIIVAEKILKLHYEIIKISENHLYSEKQVPKSEVVERIVRLVSKEYDI